MSASGVWRRCRANSGPVLLVAFAACVLWVKPMGLLLWARIKILTNIPRTAIAEPESQPELPRIRVPERETVVLPWKPSRDPFSDNDGPMRASGGD